MFRQYIIDKKFLETITENQNSPYSTQASYNTSRYNNKYKSINQHLSNLDLDKSFEFELQFVDKHEHRYHIYYCMPKKSWPI